MDTLSLYELTSLVSQVIDEALPGQYWVEAELMSLQERNGHCFMQLVQKDLFGSTPVAQASAKCWRSQWMKVGAKFQKATGGLPSLGMKLLAKVKVEFHATYGFSLIVNDIDPTYTIGDMARKRQEIIQQLKDEGVFDLQKQLQLPLFCQRIAVISSPGAAGYGDFCNQLNNNEYGFVFETELFPAIMQGEHVEESVCSALDAIFQSMSDGENWDCVVIIRGGGAVADMSGFDTLKLAENVANFPIPIVTGIGHDRDECVLDMISYQKVKTPTAAAAFLIERLTSVLDRVEEAQNTIVSCVTILLERQKNRLESLSNRIVSNMRLYKTREEGRIERLYLNLTNAIQQRLLQNKHKLEMLDQRLKALDPELLLKRGYSMTLCQGRIIKDASELKPGDEIETKLQKGTIKSIVQPLPPPSPRKGGNLLRSASSQCENERTGYMLDSSPDIYTILKENAKNNRLNPTYPEELLWEKLRCEQLGVKFRRQHAILDFIADFYCAKAKLLVEVDGDYHFTPEQEEKDRQRTRRLENKGYRLLRFTNEQVVTDIESVITEIKNKL